MRISNNKPAEITPQFIPIAAGAMQVHDDIKKVMVTPMMTPLVATQPVTVTNHGSAVSEMDIVDLIIDTGSDALRPDREADLKAIYSGGLLHFNKNTQLLMRTVFAIQAGAKENMPEPSPNVVYTPGDVQQSAKQFIAGNVEWENWFANLAFYAKPNALGFYFANNVAFDNFKTWLSGQVASIQAVLPAETQQAFADFQQISLTKLTESALLRHDDSENNDPYSFARCIHSLMMQYAAQASPIEFGILPFDAGELFCPQALIFVNVEAHSRASAKQIKDEWDIVNRSISAKPAIATPKPFTSLTAATRALASMSAAAASANQAMAIKAGGMSRSLIKNMKFRKTPMKHGDIVKILTALLNKMGTRNKSMNSYKQVKISFARPNRRDPDDFNKMGKTVSTKYHPDIHVYLDCSGSISEPDYRDAIKTLIRIARKLNVSMYFNSFSDYMSICYKVNTKDSSVEACYRKFMEIPKVDGGTNFEQIWHYINGNPKREKELSLVITDFEWTARAAYVKHPENLYYMSVSQANWNYITRAMEYFAKSMLHNDPNIRAHILG